MSHFNFQGLGLIANNQWLRLVLTGPKLPTNHFNIKHRKPSTQNPFRIALQPTLPSSLLLFLSASVDPSWVLGIPQDPSVYQIEVGMINCSEFNFTCICFDLLKFWLAVFVSHLQLSHTHLLTSHQIPNLGFHISYNLPGNQLSNPLNIYINTAILKKLQNEILT